MRIPTLFWLSRGKQYDNKRYSASFLFSRQKDAMPGWNKPDTCLKVESQREIQAC